MHPVKPSLFALLCACFVGAAQTRSPEVLEVPQLFRGWAAIVWDVAGYPAFPKDGAKLVERLPNDGILITSTHLESGIAADEFYLIDDFGNRVANPTRVGKHHGTVAVVGESDRARHVTAFFVGTPAEAKAVIVDSKINEALSRVKE
jgi:hypothetical protein